MANILVVDDELGIRDLLSEILNDEGHSVDLAENATQARAARAAGMYDLVLLDIWRARFLSATVSNWTTWTIVRLQRHFLLHGYPVVCLVGVCQAG